MNNPGYDLERDPQMLREGASPDRPEQKALLQRAREHFRDALEGKTSTDRLKVSDDTLESLRALGYVE